MAEMTRIEIGFVGHQVISLKLGEKELSDLRKKLSGGGWLTLATEDGEVDVDLTKVAFVRVATGAHSVGFGN